MKGFVLFICQYLFRIKFMIGELGQSVVYHLLFFLREDAGCALPVLRSLFLGFALSLGFDLAALAATI